MLLAVSLELVSADSASSQKLAVTDSRDTLVGRTLFNLCSNAVCTWRSPESFQQVRE